MDRELLVNNIRSICKEQKVQISQLEKDLGFGAGLVSRWTKTDPSLSKVVEVAKYLNVSVDRLIGYSNIINDKFLANLVEATNNDSVRWMKYQEEKTYSQPKLYFNTIQDSTAFENHNEWVSYKLNHVVFKYYCCVNDGFISLCADCVRISKYPDYIKLYIQPNQFSDNVVQPYSSEQLQVLWTNVLSHLGNESSSEEKANYFKLLFNKSMFQLMMDDNKEEKASDKENYQLRKLTEHFTIDELIDMQKFLSSPDVKRVLENSSRILKYYQTLTNAIEQNSKAEE